MGHLFLPRGQIQLFKIWQLQKDAVIVINYDVEKVDRNTFSQSIIMVEPQQWERSLLYSSPVLHISMGLCLATVGSRRLV